MEQNKIIIYSGKEITIAKYAKAISHPARVAILNLLIKKQVCICGDIVDELPLSQSTVSQHLKVLKEAGIIKGDIDGNSVCYCIDEKAWDKIKDVFVVFFEQSKVAKGNYC
jgi:ArsR family transcriptional regulator